MPSTTMTSPLHSILPLTGILRQTGGLAEGPGFKKLAVQDQTARLPMQELDPVPGLVNEDIDISVARVTSQLVGHKPAQGMVTLAHVGRLVVKQVPHAVIQAKHGSTTPGLLPVSSPRPGCPGSAIPPLSACASLCSSVWTLVPTSCLCLFSCLPAPVPESCHSLAPPGGTPLIPARWPEPRRICVCSHRTATRLSRFLSDGSCMRLLSPCSIELSLRFLLV